MKDLLEKLAVSIVKVEKTLISILLPTMCVIVLANTLARITGLFTDQLIWAEEFARYLMIWMSFIGAALVMQDNGHYKMTAVLDALPAKAQKILRSLSLFVTIIFLLILAKNGIDCCIKIAQMGQQTPILKIPMWIPYAAIPTGIGLGALQAILGASLRILSKQNEEEVANP